MRPVKTPGKRTAPIPDTPMSTTHPTVTAPRCRRTQETSLVIGSPDRRDKRLKSARVTGHVETTSMECVEESAPVRLGVRYAVTISAIWSRASDRPSRAVALV